MSSQAPAPRLPRTVSLRSATALVVANIIGAGVFTTTGFQAADLGHPGWIFALWILGGALALCGALCYAELGAALPEAGGEYAYLRETFGPMFGFMSAVVSLIAGFSAAIAAAAKALIRYLAGFWPEVAADVDVLGLPRSDWLAISFVWLLVLVHSSGARGFRFNDLVTLFKVLGIVTILIAAAVWGRGELGNFTFVSASYEDASTPQLFSAVATSLIFVSFCYTGWNASAYVAAEMKQPQKDLPRALLGGTALVVALYLGLNAVYIYGANVDQLAGEVEVGLIAGQRLFGGLGTSLVAVVLSVSILASMSAMTIAGPRVYYAFGRDFPPAGWLGRLHAASGTPRWALLLQGAVTSALIVAGRVDQIQQYAGFTLALFSALAVACVMVLRAKRPELRRPFRVWGYPWTPLFFLVVSLWTLIWAFRGRPLESSLSLLTVAMAGLAFVGLSRLPGGRR